MNNREVLRARWAAMAPRERLWVTAAGLLVAVALVWWVALAPALRTLSAAREEHVRLDAQLQQMSTMQAQAKALQAQPKANRDESLRALESSVKQSLGANAQIVNAGDGANVMMRAASADVLAQWLAQARSNARAVPREAHLTRAAAAATPNPPAQPASKAAAGAPPDAPSAATAGTADEARPRWDGTLVMTLPAAPR
jgi:general secretion pathway protein M